MDSERSEYRQLVNFNVCQICGRCAPRGVEGWLDAPLRIRGPHTGRRFEGTHDGRWRIVRCPQHWTEWALANSVGRSKYWRQKMKEALAMPAPMFPPGLEPFPMKDEPLPDFVKSIGGVWGGIDDP